MKPGFWLTLLIPNMFNWLKFRRSSYLLKNENKLIKSINMCYINWFYNCIDAGLSSYVYFKECPVSGQQSHVAWQTLFYHLQRTPFPWSAWIHTPNPNLSLNTILFHFWWHWNGLDTTSDSSISLSLWSYCKMKHNP